MKVLFAVAAVSAFKLPVPIGEALHNMKLSQSEQGKWGEMDPEDTIEAFHHRYYKHTNVDEYVKDGPGDAYKAVTNENVQLSSSGKTNKWGVWDEEDTQDWLEDMIASHSDEQDYLDDDPGLAYRMEPYNPVTQKKKVF